MPLHLLGKKSWNVYNPNSIARVKQDEAAAKSREEKNERDRRSNAVKTRLQILRGDDSTTLIESNSTADCLEKSDNSVRDPSRKRRRLAGEDDTDRDIRLARLDVEAVPAKQYEPAHRDAGGYTDLMHESWSARKMQSNSERDEQLVGMRFVDAAGYKSIGKPWYSDKSLEHKSGYQIGKDVWGNEDPRSQEREKQRISANDPLLTMKQGVKQLRERDRQRKEWMDQREKDLYGVERLAHDQEKVLRRRSPGEDSLDNFHLDATTSSTRKHLRMDTSERERRHRRHKRRHRSRSPRREDDGGDRRHCQSPLQSHGN